MTTRTEQVGDNIRTYVVDNNNAETGGSVSNGLASKEAMYSDKYTNYSSCRHQEHADEGYEYEMSLRG
jgi:hypothetical protein